MRRTTLLLLTLTLSAACGDPDLDALIEEHGPAVERQLARLQQIGRTMARQRPVTADDGPIRLDARRVAVTGALRRRNASLMYHEAFADVTRFGYVPHRIFDSNLLNTCAALVRKRRCPDGAGLACCNPRGAQRLLAACERLRYLFVIRSTAYAAPQLVAPLPGAPLPGAPLPGERTGERAGAQAGGPAAADAGAEAETGAGADATAAQGTAQTWSFAGGRLEGEIHVFELEPPRRLGGFTFAAQSLDKVKSAINASAGATLRAERLKTKLLFDLKKQIRATVFGALRDHVKPAPR